MSDYFSSGFGRAIPAIVMAAGCAPFFSAETPANVKAGGTCLMAIAMILTDLKSGKKLGFTDQIVGAMRKIPGLENADESTILGTLTLAACAFLGGGELANMINTGKMHPGWINIAYNSVAFPLGAAFTFRRSRAYLERYLGSGLSFTYRDADGKPKKTEPISTSDLLRDVAYLTGAAGITAFGAALDSNAIQFTGLMFMLSCGLNIGGIIKEPIKEVTAAKMEGLKRSLEKAMAEHGEEQNEGDAKKHMEELQRQWEEACKTYDSGKPVKTVDMQNILRRAAAVVTSIVSQAWAPPAKSAEREI